MSFCDDRVDAPEGAGGGGEVRARMLRDVEKCRERNGPMGTDESYGNNGRFLFQRNNTVLQVIASDGLGWDHVSVSHAKRCPTWEEMCWIKDLFFEPEETAVQFHPPESVYVNNHPFCLHLWRQQGAGIALPDPIFVGVRGIDSQQAKGDNHGFRDVARSRRGRWIQVGGDG